jgi:hypothetical protein
MPNKFLKQNFQNLLPPLGLSRQNSTVRSQSKKPTVRSQSKKPTVRSIKSRFAHQDSINSRKIENEVSHISVEKAIDKEELERTRQQLLLDKIIQHTVIKKKTIGIEKKDNEKKLLTGLTQIIEGMKGRSLMSLKEEDDRYELVDKLYYETLTKDNNELVKSVKQLEDDIVELKISLKKTGGELNIVKYLSDHQEKLKTENVKRLKSLDVEISCAKTINQATKKNYSKDMMDKDNLFKAIVNLLERNFDKRIIEEYRRIYNVFNNEFFLANFKPVEEQNVENLLGRIHNLKKQIENKEFELGNLNKLLSGDSSKKVKK